MPPGKTVTPGYKVVHPNRGKASSKTTKLIVVILMLVSVALMLIVTFGGWSKLQGMKPVNFIWCAVYVIFAVYIWRWNRGLLPIAAALAIILLVISLIAGTGIAGTSWFDRNSAGFSHANSLFGGKGLGPDELGTITLLIAPVQVLLIFFAMQGFAQGWNVEMEVPDDQAQRPVGPPQPAPA